MNRGLTKEQAERGVQPEPLTKAEWKAMHDASLVAMVEADLRTIDATTHAVKRRGDG